MPSTNRSYVKHAPALTLGNVSTSFVSVLSSRGLGAGVSAVRVSSGKQHAPLTSNSCGKSVCGGEKPQQDGKEMAVEIGGSRRPLFAGETAALVH